MIGSLKKPLIVIVGLAAAVVAWYLVSPLFINRTVNEDFVLEIPSEEQVAAMSPEERAAVENRLMATASVMPDKTMADPVLAEVAGQVVLLVEGMFQDGDEFHKGSGTAKVYQRADGSQVLRLEDFAVTNGPDLHVLLSPRQSPAPREALGEYVNLGELKGNRGSQNYDLPTGIDIFQYQTVVIYCLPFHVVFSTAVIGQ